eukprot:TRINITY_DN14213_c0_g1_i1.p1 TRINITY_DN14213_c0_g1~~TRINITY_DN14213_c0_g1_i1.p1  ORF type:complete len:364 (-),score=54.39 TRINITY_DN14213_c0_g1_i1:733-1824(-)
MSLVFEDTFSKDGPPNPSIYSYDWGGHGFGNDEQQFYTNDNAVCKGGNLILEARKEKIEAGGHCREYSSSRIVTKSQGDWKYGTVMVSAKLPKGRGTWPAIWMLPTDESVHGKWPNSGEIDIMEHVGYEMGKVHGNIHFKGDADKDRKGASVQVANIDTQFHLYRLDWTPQAMRISVDGNTFLTYHNPSKGGAHWPFDTKFHLMINIAVGGNWGGKKGIDDSCFPARMYVDYIRVFNNRVKIRSFHQKFLSADRAKGDVDAAKDVAKEWEEWELFRKHHDNDVVCLRSWHQKFLTADTNGNVFAAADEPKEWECWRLHSTGDHHHLKSHHGKFLCSEHGSFKVKADRATPGDWERWEIQFLEQ